MSRLLVVTNVAVWLLLGARTSVTETAQEGRELSRFGVDPLPVTAQHAEYVEHLP